MKKHLREAIRLAGLRLSDVTVAPARGHYRLTVAGVTTTASGSPRCADTAAWRIADDLRRLAGINKQQRGF